MQNLLKFIKMHALGNDFVILDRLTQSFFIDHLTIKALSNKKTGVGFDQLLILEPPFDIFHDFSYQIYNSNGSQAKQCLNGVRCLAHYVNDTGLIKKRTVKFQTLSQSVSCEVLSPIVVKTSLHLESELLGYEKQLNIFDTKIDHVIIGNEHLICWNVDQDGKKSFLAELKTTNLNPDLYNISFANQQQSSVMLETFERGVGWTASCGSAALATFIAYNQHIQPIPSLRIETKYGYVTAHQNNDRISLIGPVNRVFTGEFLLKYS